MSDEAKNELEPRLPQSSRKRQAVINVAFIYVTTAVMIIQGFIVTPLALLHVSESLFGAWLATGNILAWITLADPGVSRIIQQRVAYIFGRRDIEHLSETIGTGMVLGTAVSLLPLLAVPLSGPLVGTLDLPAAEYATLVFAFQLALVGTALSIATYAPAAVNHGLQLSLSAGMSYCVGAVAGIIATIALLGAGVGLIAIPLGMITRAAIMLLGNLAAMWFWYVRHVGWRFMIRGEEMRKYRSLSALTFIERLGHALLSQSDAYLIARVESNTAVTQYAMTGRAYDPVRMSSERFAPALLSGLAHMAGEGQTSRLLEVILRLINLSAFMVSVGAACVVALNFAFVDLWLGPGIFGGQSLTVALAVFVVTSVIFGSLAEIVFAVGGVGNVELMRAAEGIVRVILQVVMLRWIGVLGIPIAACLSVVLVSGWYLPRLASRYVGASPWAIVGLLGGHCLRAALLLACGVGGWAVMTQVSWTWTWWRLVLSGAACLGVFGGIGLAIYPSMRDEVRRLVAHLTARFAVARAS